jgi:hypothetical protein
MKNTKHRGKPIMYLPQNSENPDNFAKTNRRKKSPPKIEPQLPASELGKRYVKYFSHPWSAIVAPALIPFAANNFHSKPAWTTIDYYLQPSELWAYHQNNDLLVGIRFGSYTRYATIDIDTGSDYHNLEAYQTIKAALEDIGILDIVPIQSSHSGGYHLIIPFTAQIPTFNLACALEQTIKDTGGNISAGQIEIFPNPKPWGKDSITNYKAIRCPMQPGSGALLLDEDLQPISDSVATFLDHCDHAASRQDLSKLRYACKKARKRHTREQYRQKAGIKIEQWQADWEQIIATGWTGYGQTNTLLQIIVGYGIVFLDLQDENLIKYAVETARNAPGYTQYCRHQHRIETRVRDWVKCTIRHQWYTPYASYPKRPLGTYLNTFALAIADIREITKYQNQNNVIPFEKPKSKNQQRSEQTQKRIKSIVQKLETQPRIQEYRIIEGQNTLQVQTELNIEVKQQQLTESGLSEGVTERSQQISAEYKRQYNKTLSQNTLYKHKHLWHPQWYIPDPWLDNSNSQNITTDNSIKTNNVQTNNNQKNRIQINSINLADTILDGNINSGNSQEPKNSANPYPEVDYTHFYLTNQTWKKQEPQNPYPDRDYTHFPYMKVLCLPLATSPCGTEVAEEIIEQQELNENSEVQDCDLEVQVCQQQSNQQELNESEVIQSQENIEFINFLNSAETDLTQFNNQLESTVNPIVLQLNQVPIHQDFLSSLICSDSPKSDKENLSMAEPDGLGAVELGVVVCGTEETAEHSLHTANNGQEIALTGDLIESPVLPETSTLNGNNGGQIDSAEDGTPAMVTPEPAQEVVQSAFVGNGTQLDPASGEPLLQGGNNGLSGSVDNLIPDTEIPKPVLRSVNYGQENISVDDSTADEDLRIEELKRVTKLKLMAVSHAHKKVREYCLISGRLIGGQERQHLEKTFKMQFYLDSGHELLVAEATAWAEDNPGCLPFRY